MQKSEQKKYAYDFLPDDLMALTLSETEIQFLIVCQQYSERTFYLDYNCGIDSHADKSMLTILNQLTNSPLETEKVLLSIRHKLNPDYLDAVLHIIRTYKLNSLNIQEITSKMMYEFLNRLYRCDYLKEVVSFVKNHKSYAFKTRKDSFCFIINNESEDNCIYFKTYNYGSQLSKFYLRNHDKYSIYEKISLDELSCNSHEILVNTYPDTNDLYIDSYGDKKPQIIRYEDLSEYLSLYKKPSTFLPHINAYQESKNKYKAEKTLYETEYNNYKEELKIYNDKMKKIKELQDLYGKEDYPDLPSPIEPEKPIFSAKLPSVNFVALSYKGIKLLDFLGQFENEKDRDCKDARLSLKQKVGEVVTSYGTFSETKDNACLFHDVYTEGKTYDHMWFYDVKESLVPGETYKIIGKVISYEKSDNQGINYGIAPVSFEKYA